MLGNNTDWNPTGVSKTNGQKRLLLLQERKDGSQKEEEVVGEVDGQPRSEATEWVLSVGEWELADLLGTWACIVQDVQDVQSQGRWAPAADEGGGTHVVARISRSLYRASPRSQIGQSGYALASVSSQTGNYVNRPARGRSGDAPGK